MRLTDDESDEIATVASFLMFTGILCPAPAGPLLAKVGALLILVPVIATLGELDNIDDDFD